MRVYGGLMKTGVSFKIALTKMDFSQLQVAQYKKYFKKLLQLSVSKNYFNLVYRIENDIFYCFLLILSIKHKIYWLQGYLYVCHMFMRELAIAFQFLEVICPKKRAQLLEKLW